MVGAKRIALQGKPPSDTEYCPASSLETSCAASPRGAGTSSAVVNVRMAAFSPFILSRALILLLPLGRRRLARWRAPGRFPNPVLQRSARIQPLEYVRIDALPQALEGRAARPLLPQFGDGR